MNQNPYKYHPEEHKVEGVHIWRGFGKSRVPPGSYIGEVCNLLAASLGVHPCRAFQSRFVMMLHVCLAVRLVRMGVVPACSV